ncbi:conserved hypothetical protein [Xanthomonas citri pv. fuscans]|nr:conserved hypothetical protein [Xanthomonas citri pv. fuscans]SOO34382.1 hypothetical protein XFF6994_3990002 [Xanthomonas citri pv. fuscans]
MQTQCVHSTRVFCKKRHPASNLLQSGPIRRSVRTVPIPIGRMTLPDDPTAAQIMGAVNDTCPAMVRDVLDRASAPVAPP